MMPGIISGISDLQVACQVLSQQFFSLLPCCTFKMEDYIQKLKQFSALDFRLNGTWTSFMSKGKTVMTFEKLNVLFCATFCMRTEGRY